MIDFIISILTIIDDFFWSYIGFAMIVATGLYLSFRSKFYQLRVLSKLPATIRSLAKKSESEQPGVSPIRLYFASIGGMIGLGNIVGVITALVVGGPGALFWLWVASFMGMLIKYAEIQLGVLYRTRNGDSYNGGPMFTLPKAFPGKLGLILAYIAAFLLCIYGVEVFQFIVIADTIESTTAWNRDWIVAGMVAFTIYIGLGGVRRLANFCTLLMPIFIVLYAVLCLIVLGINFAQLPEAFMSVLSGAFTGTSAIGGFAGATVIIAMKEGAARAVYSGDIAIGFDSIIQSETKVLEPQRQARLAIVSMISDSFICTLSILVVLVTGLWENPAAFKTSEFVAEALGMYFPHVDKVVGLIIFLAGFTTIQAYFAVGLKSAKFISSKVGGAIYYIYAVVAFFFIAEFDQVTAQLIMSLSGGLLMFINVAGILKLRRKVRYDVLLADE